MKVGEQGNKRVTEWKTIGHNVRQNGTAIHKTHKSTPLFKNWRFCALSGSRTIGPVHEETLRSTGIYAVICVATDTVKLLHNRLFIILLQDCLSENIDLSIT